MRKRVDPPAADELFTTADAARAFQVGVSSIKRWTDEGELESIRTPGGHRRYTSAALRRFASLRGLGTDRLPPPSSPDPDSESAPPNMSLYDALAAGDAEAARQLVTPRVESLPKRASFFDRVIGETLRELGERLRSGELQIDQGHRASQIIIEAIDRLRSGARRDGKLALLACPPDEQHDIPLRLVRLLLEWNGWRTALLGPSLPWAAARSAVEREKPALLAFTSRTGEAFSTADFDSLVEYCRERGTRVIVGGEWARGGSGGVEDYLRFRTLRGFERWLRDQG
jgi:excisionase family DNA binding protein